MTRASLLAISGLSAMLLLGATPASAAGPGYRAYIGCGVSVSTKPAHVCAKASKKAAFFESTQADVVYSVCVGLPSGKSLCARSQPASRGVVEVNPLTAAIAGPYRATWFVEGTRVASFSFRVS